MEILYLLVGVTTTKVYSIQMCALELSCSIFFDDDFRWGTLRGRKLFHRNYMVVTFCVASEQALAVSAC